MIGARRSAVRAATPVQRLVTLAALGVFVLVSVLVLGRLTSPVYRAEALLSTAPLLSTGQRGDPSNDLRDRFIQSELLYLNSTALSDSVAAQLDVGAVTLSASQVGQTDVLAVSAESTDRAEAERVADAAAALYVADRRRVLTTRLASLGTQLASLDRSIADLPEAGPDDRRQGLEQEYQRLLAERNDLQVDLAGADPLVESAVVAGAERTLPSTLLAALVLAVGAVLGLLVLVARRWTAGIVMSEEHVVELGGQLSGPTLPCVAEHWVGLLGDRPADDPLERTARLTAGSLTTLRDGAPVLLVGPSMGVGTSFAALNVATALARSRSTVLVCAGDALDDAVLGWLDLTGEDSRGLPGLADLADRQPGQLDQESVTRLLVDTPVRGLSLLPAGRVGTRRAELVERALAGPAVSRLVAAGHQVVVDAPPLDRSRALLGLAGGGAVVGLVAAAGITTDRQLCDALEVLSARTGATVPVVLVQVPADASTGPRTGTLP